MLTSIVYLLLDFWFYFFGLECILVDLFCMCKLVLFGHFFMFLCIGICWVSFIKLRCFFKLSCFSLDVIDSQGTLHLILDSVGMYLVIASIWALSNFHVHPSENVFRCLLKSIKPVSYSYHILTAYIIIGKCRPIISWGFLFLNRLQWIFTETILWLENTPLAEEYTSQFQILFIHFLFMNK